MTASEKRVVDTIIASDIDMVWRCDGTVAAMVRCLETGRCEEGVWR